jgi:hypothetical protein
MNATVTATILERKGHLQTFLIFLFHAGTVTGRHIGAPPADSAFPADSNTCSSWA